MHTPRHKSMGAETGQGDIPDSPHATPHLVLVRATVNLAGGLQAGEHVLVDPTLPHIQDLLRGHYLTPLPADQQPLGNLREGT